MTDSEPTARRSRLVDTGRVEMTVDVTERHDDSDEALAVLHFEWIVTST